MSRPDPATPATPATPAAAEAPRARRGSITGLAGASYFALAIGLITGPLVARVLGPVGRGEYAAVISYGNFVLTLLALGMGLTVNHAVLTLRRPPAMVLGMILRFAGILVVPSVVIGVVVAGAVLEDYSDAARAWALVFIAITPIGVVQLALQSFLVNEGALGALARVRVTPLLLSAVAVIVLDVCGQLTVSTYLAATFVATLITVGVSWRYGGTRPRRGEPLVPAVRFSLRAYPASLANTANGQLDQWLLAPLLTPRDLGVYAIAVTVSALPVSISQAIASRTTGSVVAADGRLNDVEAASMLRLATVTAVIVAAGLALVTPVLVPLLFGHPFARSVVLALILLVGNPALAITAIGTSVLVLGSNPGAISRAELISLVVTAVGLGALIPLFGVVGAAIVSPVAYWVRALILVRSLRSLGVVNMRPRAADAHRLSGLLRARIGSALSRARR